MGWDGKDSSFVWCCADWIKKYIYVTNTNTLCIDCAEIESLIWLEFDDLAEWNKAMGHVKIRL